MKFKVKEIKNSKEGFISHMLFNSVPVKLIEKMANKEGYSDETEFEFELKFNGEVVDIKNFASFLEDNWDYGGKNAARPEANRLFEEMKHTFKSKNSTNAQLNKIKEQVMTANNHLKGIMTSINNLETNK